MGVVRSAKKNENDEGGNGRGWAGREKTRGGWDVFLVGRGGGWGREEILGGGGLLKKKKTALPVPPVPRAVRLAGPDHHLLRLAGPARRHHLRACAQGPLVLRLVQQGPHWLVCIWTHI